MKALQQNAYGAPADVTALVDLPEPVAKAGEILVEVEAAAMHLADLKFINGDAGFRYFTFPRICGHEGIGYVIKLGDGVTDYKVCSCPLARAHSVNAWRSPQPIAHPPPQAMLSNWRWLSSTA